MYTVNNVSNIWFFVEAVICSDNALSRVCFLFS